MSGPAAPVRPGHHPGGRGEPPVHHGLEAVLIDIGDAAERLAVHLCAGELDGSSAAVARALTERTVAPSDPAAGAWLAHVDLVDTALGPAPTPEPERPRLLGPAGTPPVAAAPAATDTAAATNAAAVVDVPGPASSDLERVERVLGQLEADLGGFEPVPDDEQLRRALAKLDALAGRSGAARTDVRLGAALARARRAYPVLVVGLVALVAGALVLMVMGMSRVAAPFALSGVGLALLVVLAPPELDRHHVLPGLGLLARSLRAASDEEGELSAPLGPHPRPVAAAAGTGPGEVTAPEPTEGREDLERLLVRRRQLDDLLLHREQLRLERAALIVLSGGIPSSAPVAGPVGPQRPPLGPATPAIEPGRVDDGAADVDAVPATTDDWERLLECRRRALADAVALRAATRAAATSTRREAARHELARLRRALGDRGPEAVAQLAAATLRRCSDGRFVAIAVVGPSPTAAAPGAADARGAGGALVGEHGPEVTVTHADGRRHRLDELAAPERRLVHLAARLAGSITDGADGPLVLDGVLDGATGALTGSGATAEGSPGAADRTAVAHPVPIAAEIGPCVAALDELSRQRPVVLLTRSTAVVAAVDHYHAAQHGRSPRC